MHDVVRDVLAETGARLDREGWFDGLPFQGIAFTIDVARRTRTAVRYAGEARSPYVAVTVAWAVDELHNHPEISMHGHPFAAYVKHISAGDWAGVADLMLSSAEKLARVGADFLIAPVNTVHRAFELVERRSPLPWLHIAVEVAGEASAAILGVSASWVPLRSWRDRCTRRSSRPWASSTASRRPSNASASTGSSSTSW